MVEERVAQLEVVELDRDLLGIALRGIGQDLSEVHRCSRTAARYRLLARSPGEHYLVTQASGSSASLSIDRGSRPPATSATVTCSTTLRRFARTAIQTRSSA